MCTLLSHRTNGQNDPAVQWKRMRTVVFCYGINLLPVLTQQWMVSGRPWRGPRAGDSPMVYGDLVFAPFISPPSASLSASVLHPNTVTVQTTAQSYERTSRENRNYSHKSPRFYFFPPALPIIIHLPSAAICFPLVRMNLGGLFITSSS